MHRQTSLFSLFNRLSIQESCNKQIADEIKGIKGDCLLNTSIDDLCDYFYRKYRIEVPILSKDKIVVEQRGVHILDVSGTAIEFTVPFEGDPEVFKVRPSSFTLSPPIGELLGNNLVLRIQGIDLKAKDVRAEFDRNLSNIERYLETLRNDFFGFNNQIRQHARNVIERRRNKLLYDQNLVSSLGFPLKERKDAPQTFIAPDVRRKIIPSLPLAGKSPFKPEPTLLPADYDHILTAIQNMAYVMERSPSAFSSMDEESLRFHFLVQLNGHYEGQATGETFNYEGKTDILIRSNGKNIFIAECKYWDGPKKLSETIDQILSYSCWRDTKVAIILFNRIKNFSKVLEAISPTVEEHQKFKRSLGKKSETIFQYIFAHRDDPNREMILTVLAFDVPGKKEP